MIRFRWIILCVLPTLAITARADTFIYQEKDGTRWITDRPMRADRFTFIDKYDHGRKTATKSCRGVTPKIMQQRAERYMPSIIKYAAAHEVDIDLIKAVITIESCFDPQAVSVAGAHGLMQLMPETARRYGILDRFNPEQNLSAGIHHLKDLLLDFGENINLSVAAYNAGAGSVKKDKGIPP
ncbi:MAG TPA: lytic transglycosylase domain-containing protein, partial [Gammaproteobacteria bacterium]